MSKRFTLAAGVIAFLAFAYVFVTVLAAWPFSAQEIIRERSPIAWLSSMLLTGSAVVCVVLVMRPSGRPLFGVVAFGLFALAVDERWRGHEHLKAFILAHGFHYDRAAMWIWGDLPLTLVPIVGGVVLWRLRTELAHRAVRTLLICAFAAGVCAQLLDIATLHPVGQLVEELLEVTAELLFLLAMLGVVDRLPDSR